MSFLWLLTMVDYRTFNEIHFVPKQTNTIKNNWTLSKSHDVSLANQLIKVVGRGWDQQACKAHWRWRRRTYCSNREWESVPAAALVIAWLDRHTRAAHLTNNSTSTHAPSPSKASTHPQCHHYSLKGLKFSDRFKN